MRVWGHLIFVPCSGMCYRRDGQVPQGTCTTIDLLCTLRSVLPPWGLSFSIIQLVMASEQSFINNDYNHINWFLAGWCWSTQIFLNQSLCWSWAPRGV